MNAPHEVLTWTWATFVTSAPPGKALGVFCSMPVWASPRKPWLLLHPGYIRAASWLCYMMLYYDCVMVMLRLLLWLPCQPGERLCYNCHVSQDRINVSAVPTAPRVSFQPLRSCLAYPGSTNSVNSKTIDLTNRISNIKTKILPLHGPLPHCMCCVLSSVVYDSLWPYGL